MFGRNNFGLVCLVQVLFVVESVVSQGGGSALDLQRMNENLMNKNCPIQVCQSVCMVKEARTGCFGCDPSCGGVSGTGMVGSPSMQGGNMLGYFNPGNYYQDYNGCQLPCKRVYNSLGTLECSCSEQRRPTHSTEQVPAQVHGRISSLPTTAKHTFRTTSLQPATTSLAFFRSENLASTKSTLSETASATRKATISTMHQSFRTTTRATTPETNHETSPTTTRKQSVFRTSTESGSSKIFNQNENTITEATENKTNIIIIFVLTTLLFVCLTVCIVFFVAWKRTARELHKNQNELYFVNKAFRQDSLASRTAMLPEPVYAHIPGIPEVPPRVPPLTPTSPTAPAGSFLLRTVSLSSETPLKETEGESPEKHDYLQLI